MQTSRKIRIVPSLSKVSVSAKAYIFCCNPEEQIERENQKYHLPPLPDHAGVEFLADYDELISQLCKPNSRTPRFWYFSVGVQNVWNSQFYLLTEQLHRLNFALNNLEPEVGSVDIVVSQVPVALFLHGFLRERGEFVRLFRRSRVPFANFFDSCFRCGKQIWGVFRYLSELCRYNFLTKERSIDGDIIVVSVGTNSSLLSDPYRDVLLGDLPEDLNSAGMKTVVFLHKLGETRGVYNMEHSYRSGVIVCGFGDLCSIWDVFYSILKALSMRIIIPNMNSSLVTDLSRLAKLDISKARLSEVAVSIFYECALRRLATRIPNGTIIHSWENQSWEHACRIVSNQKVNTIGVQHSALLPEHLKMRAHIIPDVLKPMPTKIITVGPEASKVLARQFGHEQERLVDGFDVRSGAPYSVSALPERVFSKRVLILLQGLQTQVYFHNAISYAVKALSGWTFTLRPHPVVPIYENLLGSELEGLLGDVEVSNSRSLIEDIMTSDIVVYSGSTAVFQAVANGVPAVHVHSNSPLKNDPLCGLDHLVRRVDGGPSLVAVCEELASTKVADLGKEKEVAAKYVREYFRPKTESNALKVMSEIQGITSRGHGVL